MRESFLYRARQVVSALAVASIAVLVTATAFAKDQVRVAGLTWPGYGWWYIAKAKNLAPDLDISYQPIEDPFQSFGLMSSGQLEIISSTAEFAPIGASQNMPVRMFAYGNLSHGTDKLIMRPEIKEPSDLKGKKAAVMVGGASMVLAALGYLPPVAGAVFQEVIDVAAVLNALRASRPGGALTDY